MSLPDVVAREEWLTARKALLAREKELTRQRDALNAERRRLPMVAIDKPYVFQGPNGEASLLDLFEGRRQLIVGHFMFDEVPDPVWNTSTGNSASHRPSATSSAALAIASASSGSSRPYRAFTRAHAALIIPSAAMCSRSAVRTAGSG